MNQEQITKAVYHGALAQNIQTRVWEYMEGEQSDGIKMAQDIIKLCEETFSLLADEEKTTYQNEP